MAQLQARDMEYIPRIVIGSVMPEIDGGLFPVKRIVGDRVTVEADLFAEGHDAISGVLLYRHESATGWSEVPLEPLTNDRWRAAFDVAESGKYLYTVQAWIDAFRTWISDLSKRVEAGEDGAVDYRVGARLVLDAANRADDESGMQLEKWAAALDGEALTIDEKRALALDPEMLQRVNLWPDRSRSATYCRELSVVVERPKARFSTWYEMFPRSASTVGNRHGTLKDCVNLLPYVASMGFDVLYLPPIHPIGRTNRRGKDNSPQAGPDDVGSPWAVGAEEGGHKSIHSDLGTMEDFSELVCKAKEHGIEIAMDIAFQCSPDHPYTRTHPHWFLERPDGTIQYAENPPKKYRDIYPFNFECEDWRGLWEELKSIFVFWAEKGVRIFRVDNPHTKPFGFWEWVLAEVKREYPDTIFLAEAFTRPKIMGRLAKIGFTQSYTYFTWRNTRGEITRYFEELNGTELREYFMPNLWPNTPDILNEYLQYGGRAAFIVRLILAATLGSSYGIYGPAFELCENTALKSGSEEYRHSEKYQIRDWDRTGSDSIKDIIARVNRIRRSNPALQKNSSLRFHETDNDQILCYSKHTEDGGNVVLVVVNLDPYHRQSAWLRPDLKVFDFEQDRPYQAHDLLTNARFLWHGDRSYVELDPGAVPAHVFVLRRKLRTEKQFDYYL